MTLKEAIKSGNPFFRVNAPKQKYDPKLVGFKEVTFDTEQVLADDWTTIEPSVTMTESQFLKAGVEAVKCVYNKNTMSTGHIDPLDIVKEMRNLLFEMEVSK